MSRNDPQQGRQGNQGGQSGQSGQGGRIRDDQQRSGMAGDMSTKPKSAQLEDEDLDIPERGGIKQGTKPTGMQDKKGNQPR
jgi:hypothetical protein